MEKTITDLSSERDQVLAKADQLLERKNSQGHLLTMTEQKHLDGLIEKANGLQSQMNGERQKTVDLQRALDNGTLQYTVVDHQPKALRDVPAGPGRAGAHSRNVEWWREARTGERVPLLHAGISYVDFYRETTRQEPAHLGEAIVAMATGRWPEHLHQVRSELSENIATSGGVLVPERLSPMVIDAARNLAAVTRLGVRFMPMTSDTLRIARVETDPSFAITAENSALTESTIGFDSLLLTAIKSGVYMKASRELLEDAPNISDIIQNVLINAFAVELDRMILVGDGGSDMLSPFDFTDAQTTGSIGSVDWDTLLDAYEDLLDYNFTPTGFVTTPLLWIALNKVKTGDGTNSAKMYQEPPQLVRDLAKYATNQATTGEIYLADWTRLIVGVRRQLRIEITNTGGDSFKNDQTWIKATWRGSATAEWQKALWKGTDATA